MRSQPKRLVATSLGMLALILSCRSPSGPVDHDSPVALFQFPANGQYDRDGDALVDIEVHFGDPGSGVDPSTVRITSSRPTGPRGMGGTDLLQEFTVVSRDGSSVVLEETTEALLPGGAIDLTIKVADRDGNETVVVRSIVLPSGSFHRSLATELRNGGIGIEMLPDGSRGYLLGEREVFPFDPRSLMLLPAISTGNVRDPIDGEYDPVTDRLYLIGITDALLLPLDPRNNRVDPAIPIAARGVGVERAPSGLLYVALSTLPAAISVVDPVQRRQIRIIQTDITDPLNPGQEAFIATPRVPREEDRLYVPLLVSPGGVAVIENLTGRVLQNIDITPSTSTGVDRAVETAFDRESGRLFLGDIGGGGLAELDTRTNQVVRRIEATIRGAKYPTLSPSRQRLFVSLGGFVGETPENWLVDIPSWTILERFVATNVGSSGDNASVFRPDGQLIFVVSGNDIDVYLNRE
jgi:hypothetical protein